MRLFIIAIASASIGLVIGCGGGSSSSSTSTDVDMTVEQPLSQCPSTLSGTNGHTCATPGMRCTVPVMCTTTYQQVSCTCEKGVFACADAMGKLSPGHEPRCQESPVDDTTTCPPSFETADGAPCKEVGKSCAYPGADCPNLPVRLTDYCQCKRDPSDGSLTLACKQAACPPS